MDRKNVSAGQYNPNDYVLDSMPRHAASLPPQMTVNANADRERRDDRAPAPREIEASRAQLPHPHTVSREPPGRPFPRPGERAFRARFHASPTAPAE